MLKNYLKIALRNLWRHKGFSLINIIGLVVDSNRSGSRQLAEAVAVFELMTDDQ